MHIKKNIAISDSGFIFNPGTGDSFSTNPVGLEMIRLMQEGKKREDIILALTNKYHVEASTAEKDFSEFLMMLQTLQLVQENE